MYKFAITLIAAVAMTGTISSQETFKSEITSQKGEKWWGLSSQTALSEPFSKPFSIETSQISQLDFGNNMLLSSSGRYVYSSHPMTIEFDGENFVITSAYEKVEAQKGGKSLREAYLVCRHKNIQPSGKVQPLWLFSQPVYELDRLHDAAALRDAMAQIERMGLPKGTILVPDGWQSRGAGLGFDSELYPDAAALVEELHAKGFKLMLTVTPYVNASGRNFIQSEINGELLGNGDGETVIFRNATGYSACLDMTLQSAGAMNGRLRNLQNEYGVDGFVLDSKDAAAGIVDEIHRNAFLHNWAAVGDNLEAVIYSPSVNPAEMCSANMVGINGEESWNGLSQVFARILGAQTQGFSYMALQPLSDDLSDSRVALRSAQLSAVMPIAVVPVATLVAEGGETVKNILLWREKIADYMVSTVDESETTAEPIVRCMEYQFPHTGFSNCDDQYMIGAKYMIAPVLTDNDHRMVRLPKGTWKDMDGKSYRGPRVVDFDTSNGKYAIFELQK